MSTTTAHTHPIEASLQAHTLECGTAVGCTVSHTSEPSANEDSAAIVALPRGVALVVADGVGGSPAGREAAQAARRALAEVFETSAPGPTSYREAALDGFERANHAVLELGVGAATTLAVAVIEDGVARSFHAGDSTALITGQRGRIKHSTVSHSPVGYAVEAGMLGEEEALVHEERNVVLNLLGSREMRIEIGPPVTLAARDTVLVASDGLFDNLSTDEIVQIIRKGPLKRAAQNLRDRALARMYGDDTLPPGKLDDLTFVLYRPGTP